MGTLTILAASFTPLPHGGTYGPLLAP